ncbi:MAG: hypothetical protein ABI401_05025 [Candidatus Dormibacter sp.]
MEIEVYEVRHGRGVGAEAGAIAADYLHVISIGLELEPIQLGDASVICDEQNFDILFDRVLHPSIPPFLSTAV